MKSKSWDDLVRGTSFNIEIFCWHHLTMKCPISLIKTAVKGAVKSKSWDDLVQGPEQPIPLFLEKCVAFIELEGLDLEGIYRVPGGFCFNI